MPHKAGLVAEAGSRLRLQLDRTRGARPGGRGRVGQGQHAHARDLPGGRPAGRAATRRAWTPRRRPGCSRSYEEVKTERGVIDFEDVLLVTAGVLQDHPQIAETVRRQYRHFVVDEYQDVSPLQQRLLDLWLGGRDELCVVGDASQTIYSFTGASPEVPARRSSSRFPGAQVVRLVRDYRSTPQVVSLANRLLDRRAGGPPRRPGRAGRPAARPAPSPPSPSYDDDVAEAAGHRPADQGPGRATGAPARDRRAVPHQRPVRAARAGAGRGRARLRAARRRAVLQPPRGARGGHAAARRRPRRRRPTMPLGQAARDVLVSGGWTAAAAQRQRRGARALGVAAGARRPGRRGRGGAAGRDAGRPGRRARRALRRPARPDRRGRHARLAALGQGPGVGRGLPHRHVRGPDADLDGRRPDRGGGGAPPALRRHHPGARAPAPVLGQVPHPGRPGHPQAVALPRRAAPGHRGRRRLGRARRRRPGAGAGQPQAAAPAKCRTCGKAADDRRRAQGRPLRRLPARPTTSRPSRTCAPGGSRSPPRPACRRSWSSPTPPWWRSPRASRTTSPGSPASPGSVRPSATGTAPRCSRCSPARTRPRSPQRPRSARAAAD